MTKLEQVTPLSIDRDGDTYRDREGNWLDRDEAIAAATIDNREAYARGVEDGKTLALLELADEKLRECRELYGKHQQWGFFCQDSAQASGLVSYAGSMRHYRKLAFRGARNMARVEIRQRLIALEAMKNGK